MSGLKSMKDIWKSVEKAHGGEGLFAANEKINVKVDAISTGSYVVDDCLGCGGVPRGRLVQFAGAESSGKTLLSFSTIAQWQAQNPNNWAIFIDAEYTFDTTWASALSVDLERLLVFKENDGAKIFEFLLGKPHKEPGKAKIKNGILDECIEKGPDHGLGVIVLDSVVAMIPPIEAASEVGKQNMAIMARFLAPELRKLTNLIADANVAFIAINQVRINPGAMFGNPEQSSGGSALKHACSQMVHVGKMTSKDKFIMNGETEIGCSVRVRIDKNKVGKPHMKGEFAIEYTKGVVRKNIELKDMAVKYGVVSRPNNRSYVYGEQKFSSKEEFEKFLMPESIQQEIYEKIKEARMINPDGVLPTEDETDSND